MSTPKKHNRFVAFAESIFILLALAFSAGATVTFNAHLVDGEGNNSPTSYLHWTLYNCGQNRPIIAGQPLVIVVTTFDMHPNPTTGLISQQVVANDQILCGNIASTQWIVQEMKGGGVPVGSALKAVYMHVCLQHGSAELWPRRRMWR